MLAPSFGRTLTTLASIIFGMVAARLLSKHDYATMRQTMLAYSFVAPLLMLGLPDALYYFLQVLSKLLKGQVKPSKEKMLALAVGLQLNLDETIDFLKIAGYALSPISQTDAVVEYFIEQEDYSVIKIDIVLFDYGLDPLSNQ